MAPGKKKASKSKSKGVGVDFRKVKHKVGRKLPPAQNVTKVEFKSKAIVLPGQSLVQNKNGCAVNQRRQTLKELLGQTTHYSERVRKESLFGIRDLISRHPKELALHSVLVIRNLSARMTDLDKGVRKALLLLFRSTIFPALPQEVMGLSLPIIMAHLSSAMTHLAMDVRVTAVHFLDLLLQHYPMLLISSFRIQVLQYYLNYLGKGASSGEDTSVILVTLQSLLRFLCTLQADTFTNQRQISKFTHRWLQKYDLHTLAPSEALEALHGYRSKLSESASHCAIQSEVSMGEHVEMEPTIDCTGANEFEKILEGLVSKLLDCWRGFVPEVCSTPNPDSTCLSCMVAITKALTYIFQNLTSDAKTLSATQKKSCRSLVHMSSHDGWTVFMPLRKKFLPILLHHLMAVFPMEAPPIHLPKVEDDLIALNVGICEVLMHFIVPDTVQGDIDRCKDAMDTILNYYVQFLHGMMLPSSHLSTSIIDNKRAEPHLKMLLHFIPCTVPIVSLQWRDRLLQAFTRVFETSNAQSGTKLVCLSTMTKILSKEFQNTVCVKGTEMVVPLEYQQLWLQSLPKLLWELKYTHPSSSKAVLQMLLHLGKSARDGSLLSDQYSSLQPALIPFLCTILPSKHKEGTSIYGPFVKLSQDCQELAVDAWWYFKSFSSPFLKAVTKCCLCREVNVDIVVRIIEVIHSAFSRGCIQLQHYLSFLFTLLVGSSTQVNDHQKELSNGKVDALDTPTRENKRRQYVICRLICMCIAETGDGDVVLQLLSPCLCENLVKLRTQEMLITAMRVVAALSAGKERNKRPVLPQPLANVLSQSTLQELLASKDAPDIQDEGRRILFQCCITLVSRYQNFPQCLFEKLLLSMHSDSHVGTLKGFDLLCTASRLLLEVFKQAGIAHHLLASESIIKSILQTLQMKVDNGSTEGFTCQRELKELFGQVCMASCALFGWKIPNSSEVV